MSLHDDGTRFYNLDPRVARKRKSIFQILKWKLSTKEIDVPFEGSQDCAIPFLPSAIDKNEIYVTFINHATALIQMEGLTILTDPVFSDFVGPFSWMSCQRVQKAGLEVKDIPQIDVVLLSHNHYDHLDLPSLRCILQHQDPLFIVPLKNGGFLRRIGAKRVLELDWWESFSLNEKQKIVLTPAQHWSSRSFFDYCHCLWAGFVILSEETKIFFAGDTGYASHFKEILNRFGPMDLSFLPIGCYKPRWFMREQHMNPEEAVLAHVDLCSELSIGIHFGTFQLADESIYQPIVDLKEALKSREIPSNRFLALKNGETIHYKKNRNLNI